MSRPRKSKRGQNEGSIRKSSKRPGLWEARFSLGYDQNGKHLRRSIYGKSRAEVQARLAELQLAAGKGQLPDPNSMSLKQYLELWLNDVARPRLSPTTVNRHESLIRLHIAPHIGMVQLQKLQPMHISHLMGSLSGKGESLWTQKMALTLLHNALRHAVRLKLLSSNPCSELPKAKPLEREMTIITEEEARRLLQKNTGHKNFALLALALGTGMRQGELLGLQWENVDLDKGIVHVRHSLAQVNGQFILKAPKSKTSRRSLRVPAFALDALKNHPRNGPVVFCTSTGGYISKSNLTRRDLRDWLAAAGITGLRFHDLRHTHASHLLMHGQSIKAVSQRLGHSNVELTLRVYCHLLPGADDALAQKTDELYPICTPTVPQPEKNSADSDGRRRKEASSQVKKEERLRTSVDEAGQSQKSP